MPEPELILIHEQLKKLTDALQTPSWDSHSLEDIDFGLEALVARIGETNELLERIALAMESK